MNLFLPVSAGFRLFRVWQIRTSVDRLLFAERLRRIRAMYLRTSLLLLTCCLISLVSQAKNDPVNKTTASRLGDNLVFGEYATRSTVYAAAGALASPTITVSTAKGTASACVGTPSSNQNFTVSGSNLTANLVATAPSGFEISTDPSSGFASSLTLIPSGGSVATTTLYVRTTAAATSGIKVLISVTLSSAGASNKTVLLSATVNTLPSVSISANPSLTISQGTSTQLTASGASTYLWSTGQTTAPISVSVAGPYSVTGTSSAGCSRTATSTVTTVTTPILTAGTASGSITACVGIPSVRVQSFAVAGSNLTDNLVATAPAGFEISTSASNDFASSLTLTQSDGSVASTTLYVRTSSTATAGGQSGNVTLSSTGATNKSVTVSGTVNALPSVIITANPSLNIREGNSTQLTASGASTYRWSTGQTANSISVSVDGPFSVTGNSAGGCSNTATATVTLQSCLPIAYVTPTGAGAKDGSSWTNAYPGTSLQFAINGTCSGGQVWVANGVYTPTTTTDRNISFAMKNGVAIYGGFVGTESSLSQRPPINLNNPVYSVLSGDIGTLGNSGDNSYHIISNGTGITNSAILDGFLLASANAAGSTFPQNVGGGLYNNGSGSGSICSPTLRNCLFQGNSAIYGGAIFNNGLTSGTSNPVLINCSFQSNFASAGGGAVVNYGNSSPMLTNCSFQVNLANQGGAMASDGSAGGLCRPVLVNCVLFNNGGANTLANISASVLASSSLFETSITGYTSGLGNLTTTVSPFASTASTVLAPCSPAINAGSNSAAGLSGISTDVLGNPRIYGGVVDMGAMEYQDNPSQLIAISSQPVAGTAVCVGSRVTASVSTTGTVKGYQWYRGSTILTGQTSATLSLNNVQLSDGGSYAVIVTGTCNSLTSTAFSLTVNALPSVVITANPSLTIVQGNSTQLTASGANTYQWSTGETANPISVSVAGPYSVTGTTSAGCFRTTAVTVVTSTASGRLGIVEEGTGLQVRVLGNPTTNDEVSVIVSGVSGPVHLSVTDSRGRLLSEAQAAVSASGTTHLVRLGKPAGMYLLQVNDGSQSQMVKIIKE